MGMGVLYDFIKLLIWTGQLIDERPASAIIVAPAGSGKTTIMENVECEQAKFVGDITARTLGTIISSDKVTHILLGDMLSLFGHKDSTVKLTVRLVSQMTGEKLSHDAFSGVQGKPREIGLIAGIPPDDFAKKAIQKHVAEGGFASRFLIIRYSYKPSTIAAVHNYIAANKYASTKTRDFEIAEPGRWRVKIPYKIALAIKDFQNEIRKDPLGFRAHRHLRSLVKAEARRNARQTVIRRDFDKLAGYYEFLMSGGKEL